MKQTKEQKCKQAIDKIKKELEDIAPEDLTKAEKNILRHAQEVFDS